MPEQHVNDLQCNSYLTNTKLFVYVTSGVRFWYRWEGAMVDCEWSRRQLFSEEREKTEMVNGERVPYTIDHSPL